jgi:hypothetical protein
MMQSTHGLNALTPLHDLSLLSFQSKRLAFVSLIMVSNKVVLWLVQMELED